MSGFVYSQIHEAENNQEKPVQKKNRNAQIPGTNMLDHMGNLFHADFSSVRVNRSSEPGRNGMAAFTEAGNIYLDYSTPAVSSFRGREILGHELSHVVQQAEGRTPHSADSGLPYYWQKELEEEADHWGKMAARNESVRTGPFLTVDGHNMAACPRQPMLLDVRETQFDTEIPEQLQSLENQLDSLEADDLFALSEQLYRKVGTFTPEERKLRNAIDARIIAWQNTLDANDPDKFSGMDSKSQIEENPVVHAELPDSVSRAEGSPESGFPDIPLMGPTREMKPGKGAFPSREKIIEILKGKNPEQLLTTPIHRGEMEIEFREIKGESTPCVRIYLTVYKQAEDFTFDEKTLAQGSAISRFKDIRQLSFDSFAGRIVISGGGHDQLYMNAGRPLRALQWADKYRAERKNATEKAEPVIYSFLVPLENFNAITRNAINQANKSDFPDRVENSDCEAAPNQYELPLEPIRKFAVPYSLITYSENPVQVEYGGTVLHASVLRKRLGVPDLTLKKSMWINGNGFRAGREQKVYASELSWYLILWQKYLAEMTNTPFNESLLRGCPFSVQAHIPILKKFLKENNLIPSNDSGSSQELNLSVPQINKISWFMRNMAGPWANLGAAVGILRDDYIHLPYDSEVEPVSDRNTNNFGHQEKAVNAKEADSELNTMVANGKPATEIIDCLLRQCPELTPAFQELSNPTEKYSFYDHAQLVLQKYMSLIQGEPEEGRILTHSSVVKAILFHDMHKWSSRLQYTQEGQMDESAAEHYLPFLEMSTYRKLWGDDPRQFRAARALINGDPIGTFLKTTNDDITPALDEFASMAELAGLDYSEYFQFFKELVQFYMADFASYTSTGSFRKYGSQEETQSLGPLDNKFDIDEGRHNLKMIPDDILGIRRFQMIPANEGRLKILLEAIAPSRESEDMRRLIQACRQRLLLQKGQRPKKRRQKN